MARTKDIRDVLSRFTAEIREIVEAQVNEQFASRFDDLKNSILRGARRAPKIGGGGVGSGKPAELVPCPVTGEPNKARRFSYLMPDYRTKENLRKYRGWHKKTAEEMRDLGVNDAAIAAMTSGGKPAAAKKAGKAPAKKAAKKKTAKKSA